MLLTGIAVEIVQSTCGRRLSPQRDDVHDDGRSSLGVAAPPWRGRYRHRR
jgi:hypothetical protein